MKYKLQIEKLKQLKMDGNLAMANQFESEDEGYTPLEKSLFEQIEKQRRSHNKTLLMLGSAKQTIDLVKIMLIGLNRQDFVVYPSSDKTPHYFDMIAEKIAEFEKLIND